MPSRSSLLVFLWWRDVGQGGAWGCGTTMEVIVFYVHEEPALRADPRPSVPVCTCLNGVEVSFPGYLDEFVGMGHRAVAHLMVAAVVAVAATPLGVVVVVFHLSVGAAVVVIVGCPMEEGMVVMVGLSYSGQWCQDPVSLARAAQQVT